MEIQSQTVAPNTVTTVQGNSAASVRNAASQGARPEEAAPAVVSVDREQLERAIRDMEEIINVTEPPQLKFSIDEDTNKTVVVVTDASTGELIRQLPSEEALAIARSLDKMQGLLLKQKA